jgi:hypothetical protein
LGAPHSLMEPGLFCLHSCSPPTPRALSYLMFKWQ